jgi:Na+/proline symporter
MSGLHTIDLVVLVLYLIGITVLGAWMGRKVHSTSDFFMPRKFGKVTMILHAFGTGTASDQAVTVASATVKNGMSGIWYQWMFLFVTPFYWIIAPIMRRFRAITTADVYALRYDRSVAGLFAVVGIAGMAVKIGLMLKGAGALIESGTGGLVQADWAIPVITVLFVVYGMAGGLAGAIVTDFVQGIMTIAFSFMLLPVILSSVGGWNSALDTIRSADLGRDMLSLVAPGEIGVFFIVMLSINTLFLIVALPNVMGNCAAGKTEMEGRVGFVVGNFLKRVCTIAWCFTAIGAVAWYVQNGIDLATLDPDMVYGDMAHRFLPQLLPGMLGIFIACLLAAIMSSCDSFMIASSALFTENIYKQLRTGLAQAHYIFVGRMASLLVVAGGVVFAYYVEGVVPALKIWYKVVPMMGIAFWLGLLWRRATVAGAWASVMAGFGAWWLVTRPAFISWAGALPCAEACQFVNYSGKEPDIYEPWLITAYLGAGAVAGVVVSLCTAPVDSQRLDLFYGLTRTPIEPGEQVLEPCTLPAAMGFADRRMWCTAFGLEIPAPSGTTILGFVASWIGVAVMIASCVFLVQ